LLVSLAFVAGTAGCSKHGGDHYASQTPAEHTLGTAAGTRGPTTNPDDYAPGGAAPMEQEYGRDAVTSTRPGRSRRSDESRVAESRPKPAPTVPSLGTAYGEQLVSQMVETTFERRDPGRPLHHFSLRYDDPTGAFAPYAAWSPSVGTTVAAVDQGGVFVSLVDERGGLLPATDRSGTLTAIGSVDQRYDIVLENHSAQRLEVVVSVDGLDVVDGSDASYDHDGYVLEPWATLDIAGWRTSYDHVAAFRFSDIPDSYGARTGRARNLGVIGVAVFDEARPHPQARPWTARPPGNPHPNPFPAN